MTTEHVGVQFRQFQPLRVDPALHLPAAIKATAELLGIRSRVAPSRLFSKKYKHGSRQRDCKQDPLLFLGSGKLLHKNENARLLAFFAHF